MLQGKLRLGLAACLMGVAAHAWAQGVTDTEILFGQTTGVTGPVATSVKEANEAIHLYFDSVNSQGGIFGRKLVLETVDDKYDPKISGANARKMIAEKPPIAFLMPRGTPHTEAVVKVAQEAKIPVIAAGSGADIFHTPVNPLVFNLRTKIQTEVEKSIEHLHTLGIVRIAMVNVGDSAGADGRIGFVRKMAELKLTPVMMGSYDLLTGDTGPVSEALVKANPQATITIGAVTHISGLIKRVRKLGNDMQFVTLSNNATKSFVTALGNDARGVIVVQSFPNPRGNSGIVREIKRVAASQGRPDMAITQQTIEGFLAAKLVTEALKRAGKKLTPQALVTALDSIHDYDMGGFLVSYSPTDHTGGEFIEMSIIDARGEFLQ